MRTINKHMSICVRGVLGWKAKDLKNLFTDQSGKKVSVNEVREYLYDKLSQGWEVIPMGECNNFDKVNGCMGHPVDPDKTDHTDLRTEYASAS